MTNVSKHNAVSPLCVTYNLICYQSARIYYVPQLCSGAFARSHVVI